MAFHYFLGTTILYTLSYFLLGEANENAYKLVVIPTLCITIFASVFSFKTYTKNGGVDFLKIILLGVGDWMTDFYLGNSKKRGYVEEIKQLYVEMLYELENELKAE